MHNPNLRKPGNALAVLGIFCLALSGAGQSASALAHEKGKSSPESLDFLDPLIGDTPMSETGLRLDHRFRNRVAGTEHTLGLTAEYAFNDWLGFELEVPYAFLDPGDGPSRSNLGTIEIGLKFAPFVFPAQGLAFGGGLEIELPTGDESKSVGSNREVEVEPFLSAGWQVQGLQATAKLSFGIPMNQSEEEADEADLEIGFNLAFLYPLSPEFVPLLEFDGEGIAKGTDNETVINATLGFLSTPFENEDITLGFGIGAPLTSDENFDVRTIFSVFYEL